MAFSNNEKTQIIASLVNEKMDYVKASKSYLKQSDFAGKKFGKSYKIYIPDPGKVVDGIVANPDSVDEIETIVTLENKNNSCELTVWNTLGDIDKFIDEIAKPRAIALARGIQKSIVDANVYKSVQAVVSSSANFATLSDASTALEELAVAGDIVSFQHPTVLGKISASGLASFIPENSLKEIYTKNYLGEYAGASHVGLPAMPTLTTATLSNITITLSADPSNNGCAEVTSVSGAVAGVPYVLSGVKIVDASGVETDQDYVVIADANGNIPSLRITKTGKGFGNPNAWVSTIPANVTGKPLLENSTTYYVGQVRAKDALAFDSYKFEDLPGSENEAVAAGEGALTVKMSQYGDGEHLTKLVRLDAPYAAGLPDARNSVTVYIKKA